MNVRRVGFHFQMGSVGLINSRIKLMMVVVVLSMFRFIYTTIFFLFGNDKLWMWPAHHDLLASNIPTHSCNLQVANSWMPFFSSIIISHFCELTTPNFIYFLINQISNLIRLIMKHMGFLLCRVTYNLEYNLYKFR